MSDGPHRSLGMGPGWRQLAKRADNCAYALDQIPDAVITALAQDWRKGVPDALARRVRDILGDQQNSLFREGKIAQLNELGTMTKVHGLGDLLIEHAIQTVSEGKFGPD